MASFDNRAFDPFASPVGVQKKAPAASDNPFDAFLATQGNEENFENQPRAFDIGDMLATPKGAANKTAAPVPPTPDAPSGGFLSPKAAKPPMPIEFQETEGPTGPDPFAPPSPLPAARKKDLREHPLSPAARRKATEIAKNGKLSEPARALAQASNLHNDGAISLDEKAQLKELIIAGDGPAERALAAITQASLAASAGNKGDLVAEALKMLADALARAPALQLLDFVSGALPVAERARSRVRCQLICMSGGRFVLMHEGTSTVVLRAYKKGLLRPTFRVALCGTACVYPRNDAHTNRLIGEDGSIAKLHAAPTGDAYTLHDMGEKPESASGVMTTRKELAVCEYARVLGTGPRKLNVAVPTVPPPDARTGAPTGAPTAWRPRSKEDTMLAALRTRPSCSDLARLQQREPTWNETLKSYQLDFDGRCTLADDCNCILETKYAGAEAGGACAGAQVALLLGRVDLKRGAAKREVALGRKDASDVKAAYSLDVAYPLSLMQGFGIALTQLNSSSIFDCR